MTFLDRLRYGLILVFLISCQANKNSSSYLSTSGVEAIDRSVAELSPELPANQLNNEEAYGQIILTVSSEDVITELKKIAEIQAAVAEVYFIKSNNAFESVTYIVQFKPNVNPIPYHNFFESYPGVVSVEFGDIVGLANHSQSPSD